ncbi:unnamed protein product [Gulo gulo]|uniref:Vomeronasal type-1 receptor n=1 Tax=Gulo gulo TaxID=48420 RepID=A0A9X9QB19_GULGU|nr:unnamed protein product [Gulo gulo]
MTFLLQTTVGMLGNFSIFYHYLFLYLTRYKLRATDLILKHLTVANLLVIFSKGIPQTMAAFGLKYFLDDLGCKLVFYVHRVGRDVVIDATCLLTLFQVIMISPGDSRWAGLKIRAPRYLGTSSILCWVLTVMRSVLIPFYMTDKRNNTNIIVKADYDYCNAVYSGIITESLYVSLLLLHDGFCLGLMVWARSSMVFILHRHRERVQYVHGNTVSTRSSPESRATQSILVLVTTFVSFYSLSSIFQVCIILFDDPSWLLVSISALINGCFPSACPFILMNRISSVFKVLLSLDEERNTH